MTDKQVLPPLVVPRWAYDDLYPASANEWGEAPTKILPGRGKRNDGWRPNEDPQMPHLNALLSEATRWVQWLSDLAFVNWTDVIDPSAPSLTLGWARSCVHDFGSGDWFIGGNGATNCEILRSPCGNDWSQDDASGMTTDCDWMTSKLHTDAPTHTGEAVLCGGAGSGELALRTSGGWDVQYPLPANFNPSYGAVWDAVHARWIVAGAYPGLLAPRMMKCSHQATPAWGIKAVPAGSWTSGAAVSIACNGAGRVLIIGDTPGEAWTSDDGNESWVLRATGCTVAQYALDWDPIRELFVMQAEDEIWTTPDGATWTLVATLAKAPRGGAYDSHGALRCVGPVWLSTITGESTVIYSADGGVTWREVPIDIAGTPSGDITCYAYSERHRRVMATFGGTGRPRSTMSLAIGTPSDTTEGRDVPVI